MTTQEATTGTNSAHPERVEGLPRSIERAIGDVRSGLNRHVPMDALLCGLCGAATLAAPVAFVLGAAGVSMAWAGVAAGAGFVLAIAWEIKKRWHDTLDAALVLDKLLDGKDRFSTALQFSRASD